MSVRNCKSSLWARSTKAVQSSCEMQWLVALRLQYVIQMSSAKRRENHLALVAHGWGPIVNSFPLGGFNNAGNRPRRNSTPHSSTISMSVDNLHSIKQQLCSWLVLTRTLHTAPVGKVSFYRQHSRLHHCHTELSSHVWNPCRPPHPTSPFSKTARSSRSMA